MLATTDRPTILVVDDEPANRALVRAYLAASYDVLEAADGAQALEVLGHTSVDLVLLDVMMPKMSGIELCRLIKKASGDEPYQPVILLTALGEQEQRNTGLEAGADDFLTKPVDRHELLLRIRTFIRLRQQDQRIRRQLQDLAERDQELARANKELEAFSYSVSHDLRGPLRTIDGFSSILVSDKAEQLDDEGRSLLGRIRGATARMSALIEDLLNLARISRTPVRRQLVNVTNIARRILAELRQREPTRAVTVDVEDGLMAKADPGLVTIALENLLGNAWKFTSKRPEARIEVGHTASENRTVFFVRDDGAGFDPAGAGELFQPFKRLHSQSDFGGTGIGLAIVNRIASRHGGRVWAEAAVGVGATFFFTIEEPV
jgi:signal transduction histidine kinase